VDEVLEIGGGGAVVAVEVAAVLQDAAVEECSKEVLGAEEAVQGEARE